MNESDILCHLGNVWGEFYHDCILYNLYRFWLSCINLPIKMIGALNVMCCYTAYDFANPDQVKTFVCLTGRHTNTFWISTACLHYNKVMDSCLLVLTVGLNVFIGWSVKWWMIAGIEESEALVHNCPHSVPSRSLLPLLNTCSMMSTHYILSK